MEDEKKKTKDIDPQKDFIVETPILVEEIIYIHKRQNNNINANNTNEYKHSNSNHPLGSINSNNNFSNNNNNNFLIKRYERGKFLGKGGFAKCYEMKCCEKGKFFAAKVFEKKALINARSRKKLINEIKLHKKLKHENIVSFEHFFEDKENVYILLELCTNQTLNELLKRRKRLSDLETQFYSRQIISALKYIHNQNIIHRDLKLGNLFISDKLNLKLGDFGLAAKLKFSGEKRKTICGTPNYIAPEVLEKKNGHSFEVDIWSLGVIIYTLLIGKPPFETPEVKTTYKKIKLNDYSFPENLKIQKSAKELISSILVLDPSKRPTLDEILESEYFVNLFDSMPDYIPKSSLALPPTKTFISEFARLEKTATSLQLQQSIEESTIGENNSNSNEQIYSNDKNDHIYIEDHIPVEENFIDNYINKNNNCLFANCAAAPNKNMLNNSDNSNFIGAHNHSKADSIKNLININNNNLVFLRNNISKFNNFNKQNANTLNCNTDNSSNNNLNNKKLSSNLNNMNSNNEIYFSEKLNLESNGNDNFNNNINSIDREKTKNLKKVNKGENNLNMNNNNTSIGKNIINNNFFINVGNLNKMELKIDENFIKKFSNNCKIIINNDQKNDIDLNVDKIKFLNNATINRIQNNKINRFNIVKRILQKGSFFNSNNCDNEPEKNLKYFAYNINNIYLGIYFDDNSNLIKNFNKNQSQKCLYFYCEGDGSEKAIKFDNNIFEDFLIKKTGIPNIMLKKFELMKILNKKYDADYLKKIGENKSFNQEENDKNLELISIRKVIKHEEAILLKLSNKLIQLFFQDKSLLVMTTNGDEVFYKNKKTGDLFYDSLQNILASGNEELIQKIKYAKHLLINFVKNEKSIK